MSDYLILYATGASQQVQAEFCQSDGEHLIFSIDDVEVTRVPVRDVASVCKGIGSPIASGE